VLRAKRDTFIGNEDRWVLLANVTVAYILQKRLEVFLGFIGFPHFLWGWHLMLLEVTNTTKQDGGVGI
jgi:hypothetical protein